jgi:16S rRNA (guanine527-N7)-methyltransferase
VRLKTAGLRIATAQIGLICSYFGLLAKWNEKVNLTGYSLPDEHDEALDRLVVEPLLAAQCFEKHARRAGLSEPASLLDLGSGGGSPAIPLKIAFPSARLTMVETKGRKVAFLREVIRELGWNDATVVQVRIEELLADQTMNGSADLVSVRAVRMTSKQWPVLASLLSPKGRVLWFRGIVGATAVPPIMVEEHRCQLGWNNEAAILRRIGS